LAAGEWGMAREPGRLHDALLPPGTGGPASFTLDGTVGAFGSSVVNGVLIADTVTFVP
jgi:hypothetical protein